MSTIKYNGIELQSVLTRSIERTPVWDGPTYVGMRFDLHVQAVYNPGLTSYITDDSGGAPIGFFKVMAPVTDVTIRHLLLQARRQLVYTAGDGTVVAQAPALKADGTAYAADAANGPFPLYCKVTEVHGQRTFIVHWGVSFVAVECRTTPPNALLSHRWVSEEDLDQDYFGIRTIRGHAVFRSDVMLDRGLRPDDFRGWLLHPVPPGYQRVRINVVATEDGRALRYTLIDRERFSNLIASGVTRIEGVQTVSVRRIGKEEMVTGTIGGIAGWINFDGPNGEPGMNWGNALRSVARVIPTFTNGLVVKVWGNPTSTRDTLIKVAFTTMFARLAKLSRTHPNTQCDLSQDIVGRWVQLRTTFLMGPITTIANAQPALYKYLPDTDEITGVLTSAEIANPLPPGQNGVRGRYLGAIAAQVLMAPCQVSPAPSLPGPGQQATPP